MTQGWLGLGILAVILLVVTLLLVPWITTSSCNSSSVDLPLRVSSDTYDLVIPVGPKDVEFVVQVLPTLWQNVEGLRTIHLVTGATIEEWPPSWPLEWSNNIHVVKEEEFPFAASDVLACSIRADRVGWYLQQLYKLYAARVIPDLTPNFVVWDADTLLLTPQRFFVAGTGVGRFGLGDQYHGEYFRHMSALHPSLRRQDPALSGICNFMPFYAPFLDEMMHLVEDHHRSSYLPFWQLFLRAVNLTTMSGASEFEMYFNFLLAYHPEGLELMDPPLRFDNFRSCSPSAAEQASPQFDVVSVHWYLRVKPEAQRS